MTDVTLPTGGRRFTGIGDWLSDKLNLAFAIVAIVAIVDAVVSLIVRQTVSISTWVLLGILVLAGIRYWQTVSVKEIGGWLGNRLNLASVIIGVIALGDVAVRASRGGAAAVLVGPSTYILIGVLAVLAVREWSAASVAGIGAWLGNRLNLAFLAVTAGIVLDVVTRIAANAPALGGSTLILFALLTFIALREWSRASVAGIAGWLANRLNLAFVLLGAALVTDVVVRIITGQPVGGGVTLILAGLLVFLAVREWSVASVKGVGEWLANRLNLAFIGVAAASIVDVVVRIALGQPPIGATTLILLGLLTFTALREWRTVQVDRVGRWLANKLNLAFLVTAAAAAVDIIVRSTLGQPPAGGTTIGLLALLVFVAILDFANLGRYLGWDGEARAPVGIANLNEIPPLGLPVGTVRSLIAIGLVTFFGVTIAGGGAMDERLSSAMLLILGLYFGSRIMVGAPREAPAGELKPAAKQA